MPVEYKLNQATIEVKGVMSDGRPFRVNTQGDVVIRTKKNPWEQKEFYMDSYHSHAVTTAPEYELVANLTHDTLKDSVFTLRIEKQKVTRSITADFGPGVETSELRKRLGVPAEFKMKFRENRTRVTFTWEEEV